MNKIISDEKRLNKLYHQPKENMYSYSFFQDLSTGFAYSLAEKTCQKDFFSFEPQNCDIEHLFKANSYYDISYSIEEVFEKAMYSLIVYGKAYLYIQAEYEKVSTDRNKAERENISSLEIKEIKGFIKKRTDFDSLFVSRGFRGGGDGGEKFGNFTFSYIKHS